MNQTQRQHFEQLQADRRTIEQAAAWLRERAWMESYAGLSDKDRCFFVAGLFDVLSLQLDRVDSAVRYEVVLTSRWLLGDRSL